MFLLFIGEIVFIIFSTIGRWQRVPGPKLKEDGENSEEVICRMSSARKDTRK